MARVTLVMVWILAFAGCGEADYARSTPEDVFESARRMVANEDYERLHELLWTEDPRERAVYLRVGRMFGAVGELAQALAQQFPDEVEKLKADGGENLLASMMNRRRVRGGPGGNPAMEDAFRAILADPYGFIERSEGRLSVQLISDERAAILWDGEGVLPPFGLVMREEAGYWYVDPPIRNPLVARWRPTTDEEFAILGYLFDVLTEAARELAAEVRSGRLRTLTEVASDAGRKAFVPAGMCFYAYSQAIEARDAVGED